MTRDCHVGDGEDAGAAGMELLRHFWDVVIAVNPQDARLDEAQRFPVCRADALRDVFARAGLTSIGGDCASHCE